MSDPRTRPLYELPDADPRVPRVLPAAPGSAPAGSEALARAAQELREQPEPGWVEVAGRLRDRLRTVNRPGRPLTVRDDPAGSLQVDTRVVVDLVRRALSRLPGTRPVAVRVAARGTVPTGVQVEVEVAYGLDAVVAAQDVRTATAAVLADLLEGVVPVDVAVVDVLTGD